MRGVCERDVLRLITFPDMEESGIPAEGLNIRSAARERDRERERVRVRVGVGVCVRYRERVREI